MMFMVVCVCGGGEGGGGGGEMWMEVKWISEIYTYRYKCIHVT